jgi:4-hydroxy-tetrahydrodipicolinate synthase
MDTLERTWADVPWPRPHPDGRGPYPKAEIPKPAIFAQVPRRFCRYGHDPARVQAALAALSPPPDLVLVTSIMTYWYPGVDEAVRLCRRLWPRVPVVVGISHQDTATCIALGQAAFAAGATGVMVAPPHLDDPSPEQVLALYSRIAEAVNGPIVVQDYPVVTNVVLSPDLLATLAERIPHVRHLKMEDPPLMTKIRAIRARTDRLAIFGGLGGMFLLEELQAGAAGTMTGFAFTEILVATYRAFSAGRLAEAERIFDRYLPLIRFENQPLINLSIRKELLYRRGAIACPVLRDPYVPIDEGTHQEIDWILRRVGISDPTQPLTF